MTWLLFVGAVINRPRANAVRPYKKNETIPSDTQWQNDYLRTMHELTPGSPRRAAEGVGPYKKNNT